MKKNRFKIGDLVAIKGYERDFGIGLILNTITNGFNGQKQVLVKLKDKECWCPTFTLRKVTYEGG
jgi:hypothetical protein